MSASNSQSKSQRSYASATVLHGGRIARHERLSAAEAAIFAEWIEQRLANLERQFARYSLPLPPSNSAESSEPY